MAAEYFLVEEHFELKMRVENVNPRGLQYKFFLSVF
jgi:hypothetical protein